MIIFAEYNLAKYLSTVSKCTIMNFISPIVIGVSLNNLIPRNDVTQLFYQSIDSYPSSSDEKVYYRELFRSSYLQYLCEYDPFMCIMDIMVADYLNPDNIIILTDLNNELVSNMVECISQFIYDRWRYTTATIFDIEDYMNIKQSEIDPKFIGVFNADKEYYLSHVNRGDY